MPKELPPAEPQRSTGSVTKPTLQLETYKRKELEQQGLRPVRQLSRMCIDTIVKNFQSAPPSIAAPLICVLLGWGCHENTPKSSLVHNERHEAQHGLCTPPPARSSGAPRQQHRRARVEPADSLGGQCGVAVYDDINVLPDADVEAITANLPTNAHDSPESSSEKRQPKFLTDLGPQSKWNPNDCVCFFLENFPPGSKESRISAPSHLRGTGLLKSWDQNAAQGRTFHPAP